MRAVERITAIAPAAWDACAGAGNPFVSHAFLAALEESGSCRRETGWAPHHLVMEDAGGAVLGAVPMYLKSHSYGEYVFDHGWAHAYERAGGRYYPKLQVAVPFTPVPGPRLLVPPGPEQAARQRQLGLACVEVAKQLGVSSLHVTFPTAQEWETLGQAGLLQRTGVQFHWFNHGYASFGDFLETLSSRKRKTIRKERRAALQDGQFVVRVLSGDDLTSQHWDAFFGFYMDTGSRKWGRPYLTRAFFDRVHMTMRDQIVLVLVEREGRAIAGALNFRGADALYGRNWGCLEDHRFLHFEACYYQAIEYAIQHKIARVEAGAQGPHKLARGYVPCTTYSAHWIADTGFRDAVARFLAAERAEVSGEIAALAEYAPYRKDLPPPEEDI
ncbi:MAG: N-acetyltransferase [Alphaproteobacteria bacterium]|nr:N-acetyltransferase [Alphaproteobacteria bacterium]